jgi:hypothetical protein
LKRVAGVLVAAFVLAAPAAGQAATLGIGPAKPCYRTGDNVAMLGGGYTPGALATVALDNQPLGQLMADATGAIGSPLRLGTLRGVTTHTLTVVDTANPANVGTASFLGSAVSVRVRPANGRAGRPKRIRATGFTTGKRLYAHVRRGRYRRNVRVGKLRGPCHRIKARRIILPAGLRTGRYRVQFDTRRRYSPKTKVKVGFRVRVYRTFGAAAGAAAARGEGGTATSWTLMR